MNQARVFFIKSKIKKYNNSYYALIPFEFIELLGLGKNDDVLIVLSDDVIVDLKKRIKWI